MNAEQLKDMQEVVEDAKANALRFPEISFDDLEALVKLGFECLKLREQQRWIPVSERLPCKYTDVLLWTTEGQDYGTLHVFDDGRHFINDCFDGTKVTHWMPLPVAPAGEQA